MIATRVTTLWLKQPTVFFQWHAWYVRLEPFVWIVVLKCLILGCATMHHAWFIGSLSIPVLPTQCFCFYCSSKSYTCMILLAIDAFRFEVWWNVNDAAALHKCRPWWIIALLTSVDMFLKESHKNFGKLKFNNKCCNYRQKDYWVDETN